jgi:hypothetical protein
MPVTLDADAAFVYKAFQEAGRPAYETLSPQEAREFYLEARLVTNPDPPELKSVEPLSIPAAPRINPGTDLHAQQNPAGRRPGAGPHLLSWRRLGDRRSRYP